MFVAFIPGLQGNGHLANEKTDSVTTPPPKGTNARAVYDAATCLDIPFLKIDFQTAARPFPTLSEMGDIVARRLNAAQLEFESRGLVVASSTGAGVYLDALSHPLPLIPHSLLYKPVYDPLSAISHQAAATPEECALLIRIMHGSNEVLPLPVYHANGTPSVFPLRHEHLTDPEALRLFGMSEADKRKQQEFLHTTAPFASLMVATSKNDLLSPPCLMAQFAKATKLIRPKQGLHLKVIPGGHNESDPATLGSLVKNRLAQLGY